MRAKKEYDEGPVAVAKMITYEAYYWLSVATEALRAYQPASLVQYPFRKRLLIRLIGFSSYILISVLGRMLRFETVGWENFEQIERDGKLPIYSFWHERILAGTYFFRNRGIVVMTSQSEDGEYIARFIQKFGYGAVRGSASRGGVGALVEMIRLMRSGLPTAFTVDGPRGPRREAKMGPVLLAKKTGDPIMPFAVEARHRWSLRSWDRLQIPRPLSRVRVIIAPAIYVSADADDEVLNTKRDELQRALESLDKCCKEWRRKA
jgi:hypothetical protein